MCVCQQSGAHVFGSVSDTRDTHGGENVDTPIGQCVLIGNFRRRLARELLVASLLLVATSSKNATSSDALVTNSDGLQPSSTLTMFAFAVLFRSTGNGRRKRFAEMRGRALRAGGGS